MPNDVDTMQKTEGGIGGGCQKGMKTLTGALFQLTFFANILILVDTYKILMGFPLWAQNTNLSTFFKSALGSVSLSEFDQDTTPASGLIVTVYLSIAPALFTEKLFTSLRYWEVYIEKMHCAALGNGRTPVAVTERQTERPCSKGVRARRPPRGHRLKPFLGRYRRIQMKSMSVTLKSSAN